MSRRARVGIGSVALFDACTIEADIAFRTRIVGIAFCRRPANAAPTDMSIRTREVFVATNEADKESG